MSTVVLHFIYFLTTPISPKYPCEKKLKNKKTNKHYRDSFSGYHYKETCWGIIKEVTGDLKDRLNTSQQCAFIVLKAEKLLPYINNSTVSKSREVILLLYSELAQLESGTPGPVLGFWYKKDVDNLSRFS